MALDNQNSVWTQFGKQVEIEGSVPLIFDPSITGFRPAKTTDYSSGGGGGGGGGLISGSVSVSNFPSTQTITGTINVGNLTSAQNITGNVSVINFPASQPVTVSNFPTTQIVSGVGTGNVNITNPIVLSTFQFTPSIPTITGSGNVSGQHYVEFIFSTGFSGTIQNSLFLGSIASSYSFPMLQNNSTYGNIFYNIPSGSAQLVYF